MASRGILLVLGLLGLLGFLGSLPLVAAGESEDYDSFVDDDVGGSSISPEEFERLRQQYKDQIYKHPLHLALLLPEAKGESLFGRPTTLLSRSPVFRGRSMIPDTGGGGGRPPLLWD